MPFPTTPILDDFNRADEGPPPSASWELVADTAFGLIVLSNQIKREIDTTTAAQAWIAPFGNDAEVYVDIPARSEPEGFTYANIIHNEAGNLDGYLLAIVGADSSISVSGTDDEVQLRRWDNSSSSLISSLSIPAWSDGDAIGLRRVGDRLDGWYKPVGGNWTRILVAIDATYDLSVDGQIAVMVGPFSGTDTLWRGDNFGGGSIQPEAADLMWFPPGGDIVE